MTALPLVFISMLVWQEMLLLSYLQKLSGVILKRQLAMAGIPKGISGTFNVLYTLEVAEKD